MVTALIKSEAPRPRNAFTMEKALIGALSASARNPFAAALSKLRHYVCREHTDREGGVELQEREGRPLGAGDQAQAPNRCELLASRALVVSVAEKAGLDPVR